MGQKNSRYSPYNSGDWVVHTNYGVGQIKGIDAREISGQERQYYRVKTNDSTIWLPVEPSNENEKLRPLITPTELQKAIEILQEPPEAMSPNFNTRKQRIERVKDKNSITATARLLRDLWGRQIRRGDLNNTEHESLKRLMICFSREWAACQEMKTETARTKLQKILGQMQITAAAN